MSKTRFETEKMNLHLRISERMKHALRHLEAQDALVRDMEASMKQRTFKEPPYK